MSLSYTTTLVPTLHFDMRLTRVSSCGMATPIEMSGYEKSHPMRGRVDLEIERRSDPAAASREPHARRGPRCRLRPIRGAPSSGSDPFDRRP